MPSPGAIELWCYRCGVVQQVADGHMVAVGHGSQQEAVNASKPDEEHLGQAARGRDPLYPDKWLASTLGMIVEVKHVHNGQVGQEEAGISGNGQDNE